MRNFILLQNKTQLFVVVAASVAQVISVGALAGPEAGLIVAGQGVIEHVEKETRIQQVSDRLSIDWKSFDIKSDERVDPPPIKWTRWFSGCTSFIFYRRQIVY